MVMHEYFSRFDWGYVALLVLLHRSGEVDCFKWCAPLCCSLIAFCIAKKSSGQFLTTMSNFLEDRKSVV